MFGSACSTAFSTYGMFLQQLEHFGLNHLVELWIKKLRSLISPDRLNILAELLCFGDREFYKDWWNAKTVEEVIYICPVKNYFWRFLHLFPFLEENFNYLSWLCWSFLCHHGCSIGGCGIWYVSQPTLFRSDFLSQLWSIIMSKLSLLV